MAADQVLLAGLGATPAETLGRALEQAVERLGVEDRGEFSVSLGLELTFAGGVGLKPGELGATIEYRKVFPVIQSYGAGEPFPYWIFRSPAAHPLKGSQFVYAVVAARAHTGFMIPGT